MAWSKGKTAAVAGAAVGGAIAGWRLGKQAVLREKNRSIPKGQRIVILGAGFAGLNAARELARQLPGAGDAHITLVDRNNFLLFTPMLTEVAGGELDPHHIVAPPRRLSPRIAFQQGLVHDIDLANRSVVLNVGAGEPRRRTLKADQLVIALGSAPNYHHVAGVREHSLSIKSIEDAARIRNRVLETLELANLEDDAARRREILTFVVGGGGYTGVETMAAINDLARATARQYPNVQPQEIATILIEPGHRLLHELSADLAAYAQKKLEERGVRVMLNTKIADAGPDFVETADSRRIPARMLVWAGGIEPSPMISKLDCPHGHHGGIAVDECCRVPGHSGVWALGDCAEIPKQGGGTCAPTAQNATREGTVAGRNIAAVLRGEEPQPYRYEPIGELSLVGRRAGVGQIYGWHFSGFPAWFLWRTIYLSKMPGVAQRTRIAIDWTFDLIFGREIAELPMERSAPPAPSTPGVPSAPAEPLAT